MTAPTIYLVRHGQTDWNAEYRLQGQADTDLNETGRAQAGRNGRRLAGLVADPAGFDFVSSPMRRTRETMERLRAAMGLDPAGYGTDARLVEMHFGDWQGYTFAELEAVDPGCYARREADKWGFVPPGEGGESYVQLASRVRSWMDEVTGDTVCVTHGGVMRALFHLAGVLEPGAAAVLPIPQDRVLRLHRGTLEWL
ncbi:MAG: histidine phosphatase family protein [Hyphomicrobiales bacterium]|nr:MAG: histidine phosphatase family protein [Hyphomicrobiales bacterium]